MATRELTLAWADVSRALRSSKRDLRGIFSRVTPPHVVGERIGEGFSFAAIEDAGLLRSAVSIPGAVLFFDLAPEDTALTWKITGRPPNPPVELLNANSGRELLRALPLAAEDWARPALIDEVDLAGVQSGNGWLVAFHRDRYVNGSAVHFEARPGDAGGPVRCLVTGLAPGWWEVWRDGWSIDRFPVRPEESSLFFESKAGIHFLRRAA